MNEKQFNLVDVGIKDICSSRVQSFCFTINVYDHSTICVDSTDEDGFKWYSWDESIGLLAPYEDQPEWAKVNCASFIAHRMEAIKQINKMNKPRIVPEWSENEGQYSMGWPWDHPVEPIEKEIGYRPSMRRMRSWMKVRKSDEILWNYYLTQGKGIEPKIWHDDYEEFYSSEELDWYSDLPGYDDGRGVYMNDGVYMTPSSPKTIIQSITNPLSMEEIEEINEPLY